MVGLVNNYQQRCGDGLLFLDTLTVGAMNTDTFFLSKQSLQNISSGSFSQQIKNKIVLTLEFNDCRYMQFNCI